MAVALQGSFDDRPAQLHKGPGDVDNHIDLVKQGPQFLGGITGNGDFCVNGSAVAFLDDLQCFFETRPGAACHVEGDIALGEALGNDFAGVTAGAVNKNLSFAGHSVASWVVFVKMAILY